jgi:hypothetical protein
MSFTVCRKIDIRQPVIIDITDGNTAAVIIVEIIKNIQQVLFLQIIGKIIWVWEDDKGTNKFSGGCRK